MRRERAGEACVLCTGYPYLKGRTFGTAQW